MMNPDDLALAIRIARQIHDGKDPLFPPITAQLNMLADALVHVIDHEGKPAHRLVGSRT